MLVTGLLLLSIGAVFAATASTNTCVIPRGPMPRTFPYSCGSDGLVGATATGVGIALSLVSLLSASVISGITNIVRALPHKVVVLGRRLLAHKL